MSAACRDAGLAAPDLEEIGLRFRVTLRTARISGTLIDPIDRAVLDLLADGTGRSTAEVAVRIARTRRATRTRLAALVGRGLVREIGSGPRDPKRRYYLAEGA